MSVVVFGDRKQEQNMVLHRFARAARFYSTVQPNEDALHAALRGDGSTMAVVSGENGSALIVRVHHIQPRRERMPIVTQQATGFLGLTDSVVIDEEPVEPKKWWQRLIQ